MIADYGPDVDVVYGPPAPLGETMCQRCDRIAAVAVADVTWPVPCNPVDELREGVIVCRECIAPVVAQAREQVVDGGTISVDVPLWTADDITALTRIVPQTLTDWAWCGFVSPTDLPQGRRFLADEVTHVQQMAALIGAGVECGGANRMIRQRPDLAEQVRVFLRASERAGVAA